MVVDRAGQQTAEELAGKFIDSGAKAVLEKGNALLGVFDPFPPPLEAPTLPVMWSDKDLIGSAMVIDLFRTAVVQMQRLQVDLIGTAIPRRWPFGPRAVGG